MKIVHGFNKKREIVEKELHISDKRGAWLKYNGEEVIIEPDINVWNKIYRPDEPSEGYTNAFFHMTNDCNKTCDYCYNKLLLVKNKGNADLRQLVRSMNDFIPKDTRGVVPFKEYKFDGFIPTISFIGGEPTVADTIVPLTKHICNTRDNKIYIYTNGIKLLDLDFLKQFVNTNQIMWSISTDTNTTEEFIRTVTENLMKFDFEYGYNLIVNDKYLESNMALDKIFRSYEPQEIRYRAYANQPKGTTRTLSSIMKFIEKTRDVSYNHYLNNATFRHGPFVSSLSYDKTENPKTGNVAIAVLPVWNSTFAELLCKWGSFVINTKTLNIPGECHMNSVDLFKYRMKHTAEYITDGTKIVWGKVNPHY